MSPNEAAPAAEPSPPPPQTSVPASPPHHPSLRSRLRRRAGTRPRRSAAAGGFPFGTNEPALTLTPLTEVRSTSASEDKALVAEERTALVRFIVVLLNIGTYWLWLAPTGLGIPPLAAALSVVAFGYGTYDLLFHPYRHFPILATSAWTTLTDGLLITLWLHATGGFASPYYLLWYLSLVAVTFRYDWRAPLLAAAVYGIAYTGLVAATAPLSVHAVDMAIRVSYIFLCGGLGALLARETTRAFEAKSRLDERMHEAESFRSLAEASREALVVSSQGWCWNATGPTAN